MEEVALDRVVLQRKGEKGHTVLREQHQRQREWLYQGDGHLWVSEDMGAPNGWETRGFIRHSHLGLPSGPQGCL